MLDIQARNAELNQAIRDGRVLDVFEDLYHPDVVMMENDDATRGLKANLEREKQFFGSIEQMHEARVDETAVNGDTSFTHMCFDCTMKDGSRMKIDEIAQRHWKDGKVVEERFFYDA